MSRKFKPGDLVIYFNGFKAEVVKIKRLVVDGAFIFTHEGDTASKCSYAYLYPIENGYVIKETTLGGGWNG